MWPIQAVVIPMLRATLTEPSFSIADLMRDKHVPRLNVEARRKRQKVKIPSGIP
jgi:desulfoferrodoxin (superoxide reductase-like protein)